MASDITGMRIVMQNECIDAFWLPQRFLSGLCKVQPELAMPMKNGTLPHGNCNSI